MSRIVQGRFLLRTGLAFAFFYAAIQSIRFPEAWGDWIPKFILALIPVSPTILIDIVAVGQIGLGLLLVSGRRERLAGGIAAAFLFGITVFNLRLFDIAFRDVSLALAAAALAVLAPEDA